MAKPQTAQNISSSASRAESAIAALKLRVVPSAPPATAVTIPTRAPPTAAARNTAGKYGVKNTSGRIWAIPQRAIVDKARQPAAKPVLKSSEGWEIPCQPRRNSSINFFIGIVTSRDQRIQNMAEHIENRGFASRRWQYSAPHRRTSGYQRACHEGREAGISVEPGAVASLRSQATARREGERRKCPQRSACRRYRKGVRS